MAIDIVCLRTSMKDLQIESESLESEVDTLNCCHICPPLSYPVALWNCKHANVGLFFYCFLNLLHVPEHCGSTYSQINDSCWDMLSNIPFFPRRHFWEPNLEMHILHWAEKLSFVNLVVFYQPAELPWWNSIFPWYVTYFFTYFIFPVVSLDFLIYLY